MKQKVYVYQLVSESGDRYVMVFERKPTEEELQAAFKRRGGEFTPMSGGPNEFGSWIYVEEHGSEPLLKL